MALVPLTIGSLIVAVPAPGCDAGWHSPVTVGYSFS